MYGDYWSFTSYINSADLALVAKTITDLLIQENGCSLLPQIPYLLIDIKKLRWRYVNERPPLLIVALAPGRNGWTVVRTNPAEWLFLRANKEHPRLSDIAMQLRCNAFFYRVVEDIDGLLMEVDAEGNFRFDYNISHPQFSLLEVPKSFREAMEVGETKTDYYTDGGYGKANLVSMILARLIDSFQGRWYCYDLYNMAYENVQWLKQMNVKLLYFLPPKNYLSTLPRYHDDPEDSWDQLTGHWYESPF
jgi:hypothetical protein